ncbi:ABC transporter ATP-binding protein [Granulicella cerasi]|uniref:ABC transporter ATP-binding protein n=1 Tax=Granulicella cerasi TaxID=741063 RepID=A0ABW1Z735_9BACT|nr:ABC transporter ATP-binding protein [Granulicella cerasi]
MNSASQTTLPAIALDRCSRLYGRFAALREVTLDIAAGSSVVLLGENGAGKSTLLRLVAGLTSPSLGSIRVFGEEPLDVRERIAYMSHATMLYDEMTAVENLAYFASLYEGFTTLIAPDESLRAVGLDPANPRRVGEYSQGMRQRAALARVLMTSPDLLLLDEPFSNLDVDSANAMVARLKQWQHEPSHNGTPRTLLLTTHQAELARPLAQTTLRMNGGRLLSFGDAA